MRIERYLIKEIDVDKTYYWNGDKKVWWDIENGTWYHNRKDAEDEIDFYNFIDCEVIKIIVDIEEK